MPTKTKIRVSGADSLHFETRSGTRQGWALAPTLFNYIIDWILGEALQGYPGFLVGTNIHVSHLVYADDIVLLNNSYWEACLKQLMVMLQQFACALTFRKLW